MNVKMAAADLRTNEHGYPDQAESVNVKYIWTVAWQEIGTPGK